MAPAWPMRKTLADAVKSKPKPEPAKVTSIEKPSSKTPSEISEKSAEHVRKETISASKSMPTFARHRDSNRGNFSANENFRATVEKPPPTPQEKSDSVSNFWRKAYVHHSLKIFKETTEAKEELEDGWQAVEKPKKVKKTEFRPPVRDDQGLDFYRGPFKVFF